MNSSTVDGTANELLLSVEDLSTYFFTRDGVVAAVDGVSFEIHRGEILGLVGESGSGKSVTARSIMGLVPPPGRTVDGSVQFHGRDILNSSRGEMRAIRGAQISMVMQEPMTSLNPVLTIGTQVSEMYQYHPERTPPETTVREAVIAMLERVQIPDAERRLTEYPMTFSGGMRQRVGIAMAAACRPDLVIADEPTTALDVTIQAQVLALLRGMRDEFGVALLLITHDLGIVAEMCDSVAVMYAGKIVEFGDVYSIFEQPQHPYTKALLESIPRLGARLNRLPSIEGQPPDLAALPGGCSFHPRCPVAIDICREREPEATPTGGTQARNYVRCWVAEQDLQS